MAIPDGENERINMKVKQLIIKNIGIIEDEIIDLDKPLILFYGEIKQGKTTILNAVKWVFGGSYPSDIIRHGAKDASVKLVFENGSITREWYINKAGETTDRPISFILNGSVVKRPVDEIKKFLNPYLLDNEYLKKMSETERRNYFTQLFGVDTSDLDKEALNAESDAKDLRAKIKGYGEIDFTEVLPVDVNALRDKKAAIEQANSEARDSYNLTLRGILGANNDIEKTKQGKVRLEQEINDIEKRIAELRDTVSAKRQQIAGCDEWLSEHPVMTEPEPPTLQDTSGIDQQISEAAAMAVRHEQYLKNKKRAEDRADDEKRLADIEARQRQIKKEKIAKLKGISDSCGVSGLSFDESGNFIYDGTFAGMLSTSQIMKLSSELSALYPQGFGMELIDRAESLGKSIFQFIERAEKEEKSILATIVGEKPAAIPDNIGVFVVENGRIQ
jgi:DNA repair ATPase RecN